MTYNKSLPLTNSHVAAPPSSNGYEVYSYSLEKTRFVTEPLVHVVLRQRIHQDFRSAVQAFHDFAESMENLVGSATCRSAFPSMDYWMGNGHVLGQIALLLASTCDCCGLYLEAEDMLGLEAFVCPPYHQVCAGCFAILNPKNAGTDRRLARLRAFAHANPERMASVVVTALMQRQWSVDQAETALHLDPVRFLQLALFERTIFIQRQAGIQTMAIILRCPFKPLYAFLQDGLEQPMWTES